MKASLNLGEMIIYALFPYVISILSSETAGALCILLVVFILWMVLISILFLYRKPDLTVSQFPSIV